MLISHGFEHFGWSSLTLPVSLSVYETWLSQGYHGDMTYLEHHRDKKANIQTLAPNAKSLISVAIPYYQHPEPSESVPQQLKVARYARGKDYHHWLLQRLKDLASDLQKQNPEHEFLCFTDTYPILEREWAWKSKMGWIGKNSMLIHPKKGSFFLLGEILTTLELSELTPTVSADHCGTCTRCIDQCPTSAILSNRTLDATKCISYWTIESRKIPPLELRQKFSGWFFGCDICQDVCPWNEKVFGKAETSPNHHDLATLTQEILDILLSSNKKLTKRFAQTPLSRAGGFGLKRNALLCIYHYRIDQLKPTLLELDFGRSDLNELKKWVIEAL